MLALKWLLMSASVAIFGTAAGVVGYDVYLAMQFHRLMGSGEPGVAEKAGPRRPMRWSLAAKLFAWAWVPLLPASSIASVPEGFGGIRISQISGVRQGTLYPGVHPVTPRPGATTGAGTFWSPPEQSGSGARTCFQIV
jgi:hypothetical protein